MSGERVYRVTVGERSYQIEAHPESRVANKLQHGVPYENPLLDFIRARGYDGLAVDVGAHIGNHALYLAAVCGLQVVAFEPIHWRALDRNVALNPGIAVRVEPVALGAKAGKAAPVGEGRQRAPAGGWGAIELTSGEGGITVRALDSYPTLQGVVLIKIDVEGMELEVLQGAAGMLLTQRPDVYIEARDAAAHEVIREFLEPAGYRFDQGFKTSTPVELWVPA